MKVKMGIKDSMTEVVRQRMLVLQLAEALGNVSEACRRLGVDRTSFYKWKKRFQAHGLEGLKDLPPIHRSHPQAISHEVEEKVIAVSLQYPAWGCLKLEEWLKLQNINVSSPTIQKILLRHNLGFQYQRWLKLEEKYLIEAFPLTPEQVKKIEQYNPCFMERRTAVRHPGELLAQDAFYVGTLAGVGQTYLHTVVDMYSSFAFGLLYAGKPPECAVAVLHNTVFSFFRKKGIPIAAICTDNGREFCGRDKHSYEKYLSLNNLEHRQTKKRHRKVNGFIKRFKRTVQDEFFRDAFRNQLYKTVEGLQAGFNTWLIHYNYERPHLGYCNMGKRPMETIDDFLSLQGWKPVKQLHVTY